MSAELSYYPIDYQDAQRRFVNLVQSLGGRLDQFKVEGLKDADLRVDFALFPALERPKRVFVILSGVHGSESYAGSAVQEMFLQEIFPKVDRRHTGFFFVHSLNPFGFKHHSRLTENKVNLNRNCSSNERMYQIRNRESIELCKRFIPREPVKSIKSLLLQNLRKDQGKVFFDDISLDRFVKAVGMGQFEDPEALEFGGFQPELQIRELTRQLHEVLPEYSDVIALDIHTGLGHKGRLHVLSDSNTRGLHQALLQEILDPKADHSLYESTPEHEEGFYSVYGGTNNLFAELAADDQRVVALTMEFGTMGHDMQSQLDGLNQAVLDHQGTHYGYATLELKKQIEQMTLERSYPSDPVWRRDVVRISRDFFLTLLRRTQSLT